MVEGIVFYAVHVILKGSKLFYAELLVSFFVVRVYGVT
jgi:hypothetical protein